MYKPALTGMRGAAAFYVVLYHSIGFAGLSTFLNPLFLAGNSGVVFFFVLSGYLLGGLYDTVSGRYFIRRVFRTFPLYYITIPLYVIMGIVTFSPLWIIYAQHYFQATAGDAPYNGGPQWTLVLEELFYFAILPVLFLVRNKLVTNWVQVFGILTIIAAAISVLWGILGNNIVDPTSQYFFLTQMPFFLVDYLIGFTLSKLVIPKRARVSLALIVTPLWFIYAVFIGRDVLSPTAPLVWGIIYGMVILGFQNSFLFANKIVEAIGKWSYSIYLLHLPILLLFGLWGIPITLIVSAGSYYIFERPMQSVGNKLLEIVTFI